MRPEPPCDSGSGRVRIRLSGILAGYLLSALIAVIVTVLMLIPVTQGQPSGMLGLDKLAHAAVFFLIVLPILSAHPRAWVWLVPVAAAYGGVIELIQPYFGRGREFADFIANIVGIALAVPVGRIVHRRFSKRRQVHQRERT